MIMLDERTRQTSHHKHPLVPRSGALSEDLLLARSEIHRAVFPFILFFLGALVLLEARLSKKPHRINRMGFVLS